MTTERKCPSCGSYAIVPGWSGAGLSCRRCGRVLARAEQVAQYEVDEQRAGQWKRMGRWLWPGAVLLYTGIIGLFQQGPPWTLTSGPVDWLMLWLLFGLIGVPACYFLLLIVGGCAFNWVVAYTGRQRLLGVVGVLRGVVIGGIALWSRVATVSLGPVGDVALFVGLLALLFGLLFLGPADSRRQLDLLSGLMVTLVVATLAVTFSAQQRDVRCEAARAQGAPCPRAHLFDGLGSEIAAVAFLRDAADAEVARFAYP